MSDDSPIIATLQFKHPLERSTGRLVVSPDEGIEVAEEELDQNVVHLHEGRTLRLGRAKSNDVVVQNRNVSRFHAVFSASSSGVVLSDLSSLNGTFVNGSRITTPVDISSGDNVSIGDAKIAVKMAMGDDNGDESTHGRTQTAQLAAVVVTVLVVDVCGYTKLSEALPPKDVAQMMHLWFQDISEIVRKHGGDVDKYIGDCVMALWRSSNSTAADEALKAVQAGIEMLEATKELSTRGEWQHHEMFPWRCRVALNTGEALMGTVGGAGSREFTVLGDTVNIAFRLEGVAGELKTDMLLSAKTAAHIGDRLPMKSLGEVEVTGRSGQIEVYTLTG